MRVDDVAGDVYQAVAPGVLEKFVPAAADAAEMRRVFAGLYALVRRPHHTTQYSQLRLIPGLTIPPNLISLRCASDGFPGCGGRLRLKRASRYTQYAHLTKERTA